MGRVCTVVWGSQSVRRQIMKDSKGVLFIRLKGHKWKVRFKESRFVFRNQNYSKATTEIYEIVEPYEEV